MNNKLRIWKLGDHKQNILPTEQAVQRLLDLIPKLEISEGYSDLVWDSMISVKEFNSGKLVKYGDCVVIGQECMTKLEDGTITLEDIKKQLKD